MNIVVDAVEHLLAVGIADREQHVLCSLWEGSHEAVFLSIVAYLGLVQRGIVHCCTFGYSTTTVLSEEVSAVGTSKVILRDAAS